MTLLETLTALTEAMEEVKPTLEALESGKLLTKKEINEAATSARSALYPISQSTLALYREILPVKEAALSDVGAAQEVAKKEALAQKIAEMQADLEAMGA